MDPHTTSKTSRTCIECHLNTKTLGLGAGSLSLEGSAWIFSPVLKEQKGVFGHEQRLDEFTTPDGSPKVHTSRSWLRPFDRRELLNIINVGACISCHTNMMDPVMRSWKKGNPPIPCRFAPFRKWPDRIISSKGSIEVIRQ